MSVDRIPEVLTIVAAAGAGGSSMIVIIGFVIVVVLLLGALSDTTRELAEVATTAIGGILRNLGTMLVAGVVLFLLLVAVANGVSEDDPRISTVAPGQQPDASATDPGGAAAGDPHAEATAVG